MTTPDTPERPKPVHAIGAIHSDVIAHAREVILRETSTPSRITGKPGGVATNIARGLARLGVPVTLSGLIGADGPGMALEGQLAEEGIHLILERRANHPTGQYLALHDPDGSLAAACVDDRILSEADAAALSGPLARLSETSGAGDLWLIDANLPPALIKAVLDACGNAFIAANAVSNAKAPRLTPFLPRLALLFLNRGEAAAIAGLARETDLSDLARAIGALGARSLVLTDGGNPLILQQDTEQIFLTPPAARVEDVTGAGDALAAGTLAALARGLPLRPAVGAGLRAAALTVQTTGALAPGLSWKAIGE